MSKKFLFFISLIIFINSINITFAEIIPLKKPLQTQKVQEQKLLIDDLKPLPKPTIKKREFEPKTIKPKRFEN